MSFFKKNKKINFRTRKDMIIPALLFGTVVVFVLIFTPLFGIGNAMAMGNCFLLVYMSLSNDYTTKLKQNTAFFSAVHVGLGVLAWVATFNVVLKGIIFFSVVLFLVYTLNRGKRKPMYMQFMMNFIFFVYYPAYGWDLVIRLVILESSVIIMMVVQVIINKKRFRMTIETQMIEITDKIHAYSAAARKGIGKDESKDRYDNIGNLITSLSTLFFNKFAQINQWERGTHYLRILSVLKSVNRIIYNTTKKDKKISEDTYEQVSDIVKVVQEFNFEQADFDRLVKSFSDFRMNSVDSPDAHFIQSELEIFADPEDKGDSVLVEAQKQSHFNGTRFKYSLKTALMSSIGVVILSLLGFPYEYWYPINICILSQPFYEFNRKKSANRLLNTVVATGMLFIAFNITNYLWLHMVLLIVFVILGDIVFKMNFLTLYAVFLALIMGVMNGRGSIIELSVLRILYISGTTALILIVDSIISPLNLKETFIKKLYQAKEVNDALLALFSGEEFTGNKLKILMDRKTDVNNHIMNLRAYYTNQKIDAYSLHEQNILRMYHLSYTYLVENADRSAEISGLFQECLVTNDFDMISGLMPGKNLFSIYVLYDMYEAIQNSNEMINEMIDNLQDNEKDKSIFANDYF